MAVAEKLGMAKPTPIFSKTKGFPFPLFPSTYVSSQAQASLIEVHKERSGSFFVLKVGVIFMHLGDMPSALCSK